MAGVPSRDAVAALQTSDVGKERQSADADVRLTTNFLDSGDHTDFPRNDEENKVCRCMSVQHQSQSVHGADMMAR